MSERGATFKKISFKLLPETWMQFKIYLIRRDISFQRWIEDRVQAELKKSARTNNDEG